MVFRSKIDAFFVNLIGIVLAIIAFCSFSPFFFNDVRKEAADDLLLAIIILTSIFVILTAFLLWTNFSIKYVFHDNYLLIKGGPFKSRIPYENISKVSSTSNIFTGHRILSAREAIEIFNSTTFMGSIKISPRDRDEFINELKNRCPNILIQE